MHSVVIRIWRYKGYFTRILDKIHDNLRTLRLDNTDTSFVINRIRTALPKASFNKVMSLESVMRISSEKGYDYLKNQFQLSSSQLSRIKTAIKRINAVQGFEKC